MKFQMKGLSKVFVRANKMSFPDKILYTECRNNILEPVNTFITEVSS